MLSRRGFLGALAAPAILSIDNMMKIYIPRKKSWAELITPDLTHKRRFEGFSSAVSNEIEWGRYTEHETGIWIPEEKVFLYPSEYVPLDA